MDVAALLEGYINLVERLLNSRLISDLVGAQFNQQ